MLTLTELLNLRTNLFLDSNVKIVRHKDSREEYRDLIKDKQQLLLYQQIQSKDVFKGCDFIISFIGLERTKSLFFGVFKVKGVALMKDKNFHYDLEVLDGFEDLVDRVIIDWGGSTRSWHQWYNNGEKEVLEILPKGYIGNFPGILEFSLDFKELKKTIENPDANIDWKNQLSAINGIYMILDVKTGNQYVGSACGYEGIWQRWSEYVCTFHGGNRALIELCESENEYYNNFRFTILQSLPSNINKMDIVKIENLYKKKLGSKAFGLNRN